MGFNPDSLPVPLEILIRMRDSYLEGRWQDIRYFEMQLSPGDSIGQFRMRLDGFQFNPDQIQVMGGLKDEAGENLFNERFLNYLQRLRLSPAMETIDDRLICITAPAIVMGLLMYLGA